MQNKEHHEKKLRDQLDELKTEIEKLKTKAIHGEANLQLEIDTRIDELNLKLEEIEQKFQLFKQVHNKQLEDFKAELEQTWQSMHEFIKAVNSP